MLYSNYDRIKNAIQKLTRVKEIPTVPFFSHPNNKSDYNLNIRYGKFSHKTIKLSPFSRFGHGIVDKKAEMIVFCSPKAGSTSIRNFAINTLQLNGKNPKHEFIHYTKLPLVTSQDFSITKSNIIDNTIYWHRYDTFKKILVLRNPWERIVSFFIEKFIEAFRTGLQLKDTRHTISFHQISPPYSDPNNFSFETFIRKLNKQFEFHKKLWDEHLGLQITPDFEEVAINDVQVIPISELNNLLQLWGRKHDMKQIILRKDNVTTKDNLLKVKNGHKKTIQELIAFNRPIHPDSFYNDQLVAIVKNIYSVDQKHWDKLISNY